MGVIKNFNKRSSSEVSKKVCKDVTCTSISSVERTSRKLLFWLQWNVLEDVEKTSSGDVSWFVDYR